MLCLLTVFLQMRSQYVRAVERQRMRTQTSGSDVTTAGGGITTTVLAFKESPLQRLFLSVLSASRSSVLSAPRSIFLHKNPLRMRVRSSPHVP